jgi:hypothetical protein
MKPIDFDQWCDLAQRDPDAFERKRRQVVDQLIDDMPKRRRERMRRLQWRIEAVCARSATPTAAYIALSEMMWDSVYRQRDLLTRFYEQELPVCSDSAEVIPLYCPLN